MIVIEKKNTIVAISFRLSDWWVGCYRRRYYFIQGCALEITYNLYISVVPMFPVRITWKKKVEYACKD